MAALVVGLILIIGVCVVVKLFDDEIRKSKWSKALVNTVTISAMLMVIAGFISLLLP